MTPAAVLNNQVFGYQWPRQSTTRLFPEIGYEELNPKALQAKSTGEESALDILQGQQEQNASQISTRSLRQRLLGRAERAENVPPVIQLSVTASRILGQSGTRRFQDFIRYQPGWNLGEASPLSARSVTVTDSFLNHLPELADYNPSVFLTPNGNLELAWEDRAGNAIEIEFWPDRVEYYLEALDEDRSMRLEVFPQFIEKVRSLII